MENHNLSIAGNTVYVSIIAMDKGYDLNIYEYLKFLLEHRPTTEMSEEELDQLAPWNKSVQELYKNNNEENSASKS